jgi:hypothetical protein
MLAIISGRTLINLEQKQTTLFILKREKNKNFTFYKKIFCAIL